MPRYKGPIDVDCPRGQSSRTRGAPERLSGMTSPELVQERQPSKELARPSRKRGAAMTMNEQLKVLVDWGACETDANGSVYMRLLQSHVAHSCWTTHSASLYHADV